MTASVACHGWYSQEEQLEQVYPSLPPPSPLPSPLYPLLPPVQLSLDVTISK